MLTQSVIMEVACSKDLSTCQMTLTLVITEVINNDKWQSREGTKSTMHLSYK